MRRGYIYLLISDKNKKLYLGSTINPNIRIKQHNNGEVKSTIFSKPWRFLLIVNIGTEEEARKIEYYIKAQKIKLNVKNVIRAINWYFERSGH
jgi:putative endonuclease